MDVFDLFWTWFAYSIRPPSRLLHNLAVAELSIPTLCCKFAVDHFDIDTRKLLFTSQACIVLFDAMPVLLHNGHWLLLRPPLFVSMLGEYVCKGWDVQ